jgi:glutamine amidotransferase
MCELLGMSFSAPVRPAITFVGFRRRGVDNPDGWGIARYDGKACQVLKEPIDARKSRLAGFVRNYQGFSSRIIIAHVRKASRGEHTFQNTHPFTRVFRSREVVLAHNGTVKPMLRDRELLFHPVGETDSERLLCELLTLLSRRTIAFTRFEAIEGLLRRFNQLGSLNTMFSEGEHLFCYRGLFGKKSLWVVERKAPLRKVALLSDRDWKVDLGQELLPGHRGVVIASRPLTDERWTQRPEGALTVFKDGVRVYPR